MSGPQYSFLSPAVSRSSPPSGADRRPGARTGCVCPEGTTRPPTKLGLPWTSWYSSTSSTISSTTRSPCRSRTRFAWTRRRSTTSSTRCARRSPEEIKQARWIVKERQEMLAEAKREARADRQGRARASEPAGERGRGHQAGRACRRGHRRGRPGPRARDPSRRRGLRRRDPQHPRGQPLEVHRGPSSAAASACRARTRWRSADAARPVPDPSSTRQVLSWRRGAGRMSYARSSSLQ